MGKEIANFETDLDTPLDVALKRQFPNLSSYRILRKSIDARKGIPRFIYRLQIFFKGESVFTEKIELEKIKSKSKDRVLIVGSGPAGLFAALRLVERGVPCAVFERGSQTTKRLIGISQYWRYGRLDPNNNVCFGEGGAGLYSDGKLITRIKSPHIPYVIDRLIQFGAPEEIRYLANPHVGSDKIRKLIAPLREYLIQNDCPIHFDTPITRLILDKDRCTGIETASGEKHSSPFVVLATGHSATDIYDRLAEASVYLEGKSFALGFRVEHSQKTINQIQYKDFSEHPSLGAANYRLTHHDHENDVGVYSFCMCPGGYVISSSTDEMGVVSNGMSNYARNSPFANSAVVVSVDYEKNFGTDPFAGLNYLRKIEHQAKEQVLAAGGSKHLPAQRLTDFLKQKRSDSIDKNSSPSQAVPTSLHELISKEQYEKLCESFEFFHSRRMKGFISKEAQLFGVETRTSAPIRIKRDDLSLESISHSGLYPTGEGAGYAGGITSAAVDGVRVAEAIVNRFSS